MGEISALLDLPFNTPFTIYYNGHSLCPKKYIINEHGLFDLEEPQVLSPFLLQNILTGIYEIKKEEQLLKY